MAKAQGQGQGQQQSPWLRTGNMATMQSEQEYIGYSNPSSLKFKTNNLEWMRISPTGEVGIGITSPLYKLHIDGGNVRMENDLLIGGKIGLGIFPTDKLEVDLGNVKFHNELDVLEKVYVGERKPSCEDCGIHPPKLEINGGLRVHSLSGNGNVLALSNNEGVLYPLALSGSSSHVLLGNGSFGNPQTLSVIGNITSGGNLTASCVNTGCLSVSGQTTFSTLSISDRIKTARIVPLDGDSVIALGNNTIKIDLNNDHIFGDNTPLYLQSFPGGNNNTVINYNNTGYVGIGTETPEEKLHIIGRAQISALATNGPDKMVITNYQGKLFAVDMPSVPTPSWHLAGNDGTDVVTDFIGTTDQQDLIFKTNSAERMRITSTDEHAGLVGIGTSTPQKQLHIYTEHTNVSTPPCLNCPQDAESHWGIRLEDKTTANPTDVPMDFSSVWDIEPKTNISYSRLDIGTPGSPLVTLTSQNRVGIGTSSPNHTLHVEGHIGLIDHLVFNSTSTYGVINWPANKDLWFRTNNTPGDVLDYATQMIIKSNGNVGVGTTEPTSKFTVKTKDIISNANNIFSTKIADFIFHNESYNTENITSPQLDVWGFFGYIDPDNGTIGKINLRATSSEGISSDPTIGTDLTLGTQFAPDAVVIKGKLIDAGKVGIGTNNPKERLQIGNTFTFHDDAVNSIMAKNFYFDGQDKRIAQGKASAIYFGSQGDIALKVAPTGEADEEINSWTNALYVDNSGRVGIGTTTPDVNTKLDVWGTIRACEARVNTTGCDFVFDVNYKLICL